MHCCWLDLVSGEGTYNWKLEMLFFKLALQLLTSLRRDTCGEQYCRSSIIYPARVSQFFKIWWSPLQILEEIGTLPMLVVRSINQSTSVVITCNWLNNLFDSTIDVITLVSWIVFSSRYKLAFFIFWAICFATWMKMKSKHYKLEFTSKAPHML